MKRDLPLFQGAVCLQLSSHPAVTIAATELVSKEQRESPALIGTPRRLRDTVEALVARKPTPWVCVTRSWPELKESVERARSESYDMDVVFYLVAHARDEELQQQNRNRLELARELLSQLAVHTNRVEEQSDDSLRIGYAVSAAVGSAPKPFNAVRRGPRAIELDARTADESIARSSPLELARLRREQILEREAFLSAREVHAAQGGASDAPGAANAASRLRRNGELLGVWTGREYRYPSFQFDPTTGRAMVDEVRELLKVLPADPSGWRQTAWMFQAHARLDGRRPADAFAEQSAFVIQLARDTFANPDAQW